MMKIKTAIAVFSALFVVACSAPAVWEKSGGNDARRRADLANCAGFADAEAGRMYERDVPGADFDNDGTGVGAGFRTTMARHDALARSERMISDCMRRKGYSRTK